MIIRWPKHIRANCDGKSERCNIGSCYTCNLFICTTCGGAEGSLATYCPGRRLTVEEQDAVYNGQLDFTLHGKAI